MPLVPKTTPKIPDAKPATGIRSPEVAARIADSMRRVWQERKAKASAK